MIKKQVLYYLTNVWPMDLKEFIDLDIGIKKLKSPNWVFILMSGFFITHTTQKLRARCIRNTFFLMLKELIKGTKL